MDMYVLLAISELLLGLCTGIVMHRSDFCFAGAFRDLFLFRRPFMIRNISLIVVTSMVLFEAGRLGGLMPLYPFPLFGPPSATNLLGGFLFGIGMVMAGGCVVGTLYRMGGGSILSLTTFAGIVLGTLVYAEIHPLWKQVERGTRLGRSVTLSQALGISPIWLIAAAVLLFLALAARWFRGGRWRRESAVEGYLQPAYAALILALLSFISVLVSGMPPGITTAYAKLGAYLESAFWNEHVTALAYFKTMPMNYPHPLTNVPLQGGPAPVVDAIFAIQFPFILGIVVGGMVSAVSLNEFRIYPKVPARQYGSALIGGIVMGLSCRMAPSCTIWHLLGGLPIFAIQSILFVGGLFVGAWTGTGIVLRFVFK